MKSQVDATWMPRGRHVIAARLFSTKKKEDEEEEEDEGRRRRRRRSFDTDPTETPVDGPSSFSDLMETLLAIPDSPGTLLPPPPTLPKVPFPGRSALLDLIRSCGREKNLRKARRIHVEIVKRDLVFKDAYVATSLFAAYAKCGALREAREVFEKLPIRDVVSWNALIGGYAHNGLGDEALECFAQMQEEGVHPNVVTYISALKACGIAGSLEVGERIDADVRQQGLFDAEIAVGNTLVDMYAKCGAMERARKVFEQLPTRDVVTWNALIAGYTRHKLGDEALECFRQMEYEGMCPDALTYACVLKACGMAGALEMGEDIAMKVERQGILHKDKVLMSTLVDMYATCGALDKARETLEGFPTRDVVSWTALIAGYVEHGFGEEALDCFDRMQCDGIIPNPVTYMCVLKACSVVGSLGIGNGIASKVRKRGLVPEDIMLNTALIDMYAKCGAMTKARDAFEEWGTRRDVVVWNALMVGYAQFGEVGMVLELFVRMRGEGILPNLVTFLLLLNVCSHDGLLKEGEKLFDEMCSVYGLSPELEHLTCMIDLFARAGCFDRADGLLSEKISTSSDLPVLMAILGACHKWANVKLGRWAFDHAIQLDEKCSAAYVGMVNVYISAGMQMEADQINGVRK